MKFNRIEVKLLNKDMEVREVELTPEDWELLKEALTCYRNNLDRIGSNVYVQGSKTLYSCTISLMKRLSDLTDNMYGGR